MNNKRRQQLKELIKKLETLKTILETIETEEQESFDMIPESLQSSLNGMNSEEALDKMSNAIICIEEAIESIGEII